MNEAAFLIGYLFKEARKPYRDRVEVFGIKDGKVLMGRYTGDRSMGTFGGGVDPGETPEEAAAREFEEESGRKIKDVRLLDVPPNVHEWKPPFATEKQKERAKKFRGTRTRWAMGEIEGEGDKGKGSDAVSNLRNVRLRNPEKVIKQLQQQLEELPEDHPARKRIIALLLLQTMLQKTAEDPHPALQSWLSKVEGFNPTAKAIKNSLGQTEKAKTVGSGHYLSEANKAKLEKLWGPERYKAIAGGAKITPEEDQAATSYHLKNVVPQQLDAWNPNWNKLNPMLQNWLKLHAYSLGGNLKKFRQGHNAVNAVMVNPNEANLEKLRKAFRDSQYAKQTGTRLDKMKPLFESGKRQALTRGKR